MPNGYKQLGIYDGGYVFYIDGDELKYVYNFAGERQILTSKIPAPECDF